VRRAKFAWSSDSLRSTAFRNVRTTSKLRASRMCQDLDLSTTHQFLTSLPCGSRNTFLLAPRYKGAYVGACTYICTSYALTCTSVVKCQPTGHLFISDQTAEHSSRPQAHTVPLMLSSHLLISKVSTRHLVISGRFLTTIIVWQMPGSRSSGSSMLLLSELKIFQYTTKFSFKKK
jgi:hypothetical protein